MKSEKRKAQSSRKRHKKSAAYKEGKGNSLYAKKRAYCLKNGVWGFEVPEPKPWKGKQKEAVS